MSEEIEDRGECALWVWRHGTLDVDVYDTEREAARSALSISDYGSGAPDGVQFPDGTFVKEKDWPMYQEEHEAQVKRWREEFEAQKLRPKPAVRKVKAPFDDGRTVTIEADMPDWIGR